MNQGTKVEMEARTRQQEFSWTTCRAMLGKMESVAVSKEDVAAFVSGDNKRTHASSAELAKRSLPFSA